MKLTFDPNDPPRAFYDEASNAYIISPLFRDEEGYATIDIKHALGTVQKSLVRSWAKLADFVGVARSNDIVRIVHDIKFSGKEDLETQLSELLQINSLSEQAYLYRSDAMPEEDTSTPSHVGPSISCTSDVYTVAEQTPTPICSTVKVIDPLSRSLKLTISPVGCDIVMHDTHSGFEKGTTICFDGGSRVITDRSAQLNAFVDALSVVGNHNSTAQIVFAVDDGGGLALSVSSCTINTNINMLDEVEPASFTMPDACSVTIGEVVSIGAIEVTDESDATLRLQVSPFGGKLYGLTDMASGVEANGSYFAVGTASIINDKLASLSFEAADEQCAIGARLYAGVSVSDPKYTTFTIGSEETDDSDDEVATSGEGQVTLNDVVGDTSAPVLVLESNTVEVAEGDYVEAGISFSGTRTTSFISTLTPTACSVGGMASSQSTIAPGEVYTFEGTISETNAEFENVLIIGGTTSGSVKVGYSGIHGVITVTVNSSVSGTEEDVLTD